MESNLWTGLKCSQASNRGSNPSGTELTLSIPPSLTQPPINNAVALNSLNSLELLTIFEQHQRIASGFAAGFLAPQPALLTPSYGNNGNVTYGTQFATTNSLYHYNALPVGQPSLTGTYESGNLLAGQQQLEPSKNTLVPPTSQYKMPPLVATSNNTSSSTSAKVMPASRSKKTGSCTFAGEQHPKHGSDVEKATVYENSDLGVRLEGSRMVTSPHVQPMSCSLSQNNYTSSDLPFGHILEAVSTSTHASTSQPTSCQQTRQVDTSRLVFTGDFMLDSLQNSCLDLSQFAKADMSQKSSYLSEQSYHAQEFSLLNADGLLSFGHPCDLMGAVNMSSNKETSALHVTDATHLQSTKQHSVAGRTSPVQWSTASQFCTQQETTSLQAGTPGSTVVQSVAYEAVSPPAPPSNAQSYSFVDSLHLYQTDSVQVKDLLTSAYELSENPIYVKNLCELPLVYATQSSSGENASNSSQTPSGLVHSHLSSSVGHNLEVGKIRPVGTDASKLVLVDRGNAAGRSRQQKTKANTEVGVVLPMPQMKCTKQTPSNPLLGSYELPMALNPQLQQQQQHCGYETVQYVTEPGPSAGLVTLQNYKLDVSQKVTSPEISSVAKSIGFGINTNNRSEVSGETHNSPIVLTNITGNVYVNQYTMLQPSSLPVISQDTSYQTVSRYEQMLKGDQDKTEKKTCSVLLVPNEHDDEFGHLSVDPVTKPNVEKTSSFGVLGGATQTTSFLPCSQSNGTSLTALPKKTTSNAFESSYLNFVKGHKSETLSSVTNSPIKNRPVLPKYIPDTRRPKTNVTKTGVEENETLNCKKLLTNSNSESCIDTTPKSHNTETLTESSCLNNIQYTNTQLEKNTTIQVLSSGSTPKFPAKFSHKLQGRVQLLADTQKSDSSAIQSKEKCELAMEFKWKKMLSTESNDINRSVTPYSKLVPSPEFSDQGAKKRFAPMLDGTEAASLKAQQVQWTVSKKTKMAKDESADIPILVIKAVSSKNSKNTAKKQQPQANLKSAQVKASPNPNSTGKKTNK